ncbi:FtsX-like permease family protein [Clostridium tagluense]|uniref:FtsX-like permease family protein n=1 Tax=Clostridium tagluense TaxID=360422 RepID=UPI001C6F278D|nr:ABC transporter permease [Clostridium tagluense]MBW9158617.1 ABC transporter permease [Clostridium tagluense]WLC65754.1 ABC transporter permease [Clostridium tagluense]
MTLFNITFRNIKRNFHNYLIYFVSMVFCIMIYYTFTSIEYNKQVADLAADSMKVSTAFNAASIVIAVFVAMFIWYSNSFFTKKRKKEVALYSMLGVKKKQIGRMLFYENLVMGALALAFGILIGTLFSKLFVMILIHIMSFDVNVKFAISLKAIISTIEVFLVIFIIASVHSYTLIYRFQLIELFKSEKVAQNQPKASLVLALLSIIFIGTGYYMALTYKFDNLVILIVILVSTVIGTYMFFSSLIIFIVKLSKKNKIKYFRGLNMIATSQLLYRIKANGRSLATIAVLSATTITAMGTATSLYYDQINSINKVAPFSCYYRGNNKSVDEQVKQIINKYPSNKIKSFTNSEFMIIDSKWPEISKMKLHPLTNSKSFVISESTMKELSRARGLDYNVSLNSDEVLFFMSMYSDKIMENPVGKNIELKIKEKGVNLKIKAFKEELLTSQLCIGNTYMQDTVVVTDEVYSKLYDKNKVEQITFINIENQKESKGLTAEIEKALGGNALSTYYEVYRDTMTNMGIIIFLASFIGFVFLICTGSIIFFKQLSEAGEDKERYDILKKIGVKKSEIRISIARQMAFIFALPLILGITHSIIALTILQIVLSSSLVYPVFITVGVYTLIYLIYYILTVNSYCKIVDAKA